jgi:hypothetical protein
MARYFARIVRALIVSSLGFGGGVFLFVFIAILVNTGKQDAVPIALRSGIIFGLGFAVLSALVLLLSDLTYRLFVAKGHKSVEIWDLEQEREVIINGSIREARSWSRQALLAVPNVKAVADDDSEYALRASVGASWRSPGEKMQIVISPIEEGSEQRWLVKCVSACLQSNIAFDYGKNFENVESWLRKMNTLVTTAQSLPPPS